MLGPLLRYADASCATVWVETDRPGEVSAGAARTQTFSVAGHHYALLVLDRRGPYEVALDGEPLGSGEVPDWPAERPLRIAFGSCRRAAPHQPPYTLTPDEDQERGIGPDALRAYAQRLREDGGRPDLMLSLGDLIYADKPSLPARRAFAATLGPPPRRRLRRRPGPPRDAAPDYAGYAFLYREALSDPDVAWLLARVPLACIFDDHDIDNGWNTSAGWRHARERRPWWRARIDGALASYWVYQHLGNMSPSDLEADPLARRALAGGEDLTEPLFEHVRSADTRPGSVRFSYARRLPGETQLVVMDSRSARILEPAGERRIVDDAQWAWIAEQAQAPCEHLLLATSLPPFLGPGIQHAEAVSEALTAGRFGRPGAVVGERVRHMFSLEHWGAFQISFRRLVALLREIAGRPDPPATITLLSGDVHHGYATEVQLAGAPVRQLVASPFRNPLDARHQRLIRWSWSGWLERAGATAARACGVAPADVTWRRTSAFVFDNQVGLLELDGPRVRSELETAAGAREELAA